MVFLAVTHVLAVASLPYMLVHGIGVYEAIFYFGCYLLGGFGITALYHRAWTHNAVSFARPVEYILAVLAVLMLQMPARQWISTHIKHHRHTDHDNDPYNISRGFWWAHIQWIVLGPDTPVEVPARLNGNPVVSWQERYYWPLSIVLNIGIPIGLSVGGRCPLVGRASAIGAAIGPVKSHYLRREFRMSCVRHPPVYPGCIGPRCLVVPLHAGRAVPQLITMPFRATTGTAYAILTLIRPNG